MPSARSRRASCVRWKRGLPDPSRYDGEVSETGPRPLLEFSAGGVVLDDRGQVLLIRARDLRNRPVWTLPKGTLVPGETSEQAALREVCEETGYRCKVVRELEAVTYWFQRSGRRIKKTVHWRSEERRVGKECRL